MTTDTDCPADIFATTRWTVVINAGKADAAAATRALDELCEIYWYPLYAYVRRRGYSHQDAEDLTQGFFARFLERNYLGGLDAQRGRFRAFLLASLKHYMANEWDKSQSQKRGGAVSHLSLDWEFADTKFQVAGPEEDNPEHAFDREWTVTLLAKVIGQLQDECVAEGKRRQFEVLKVFLTERKGARPQASVAEELGMEPTAVRVAVHRLRKRYRELLRSEIAGTLEDPDQVDEEIQTLFQAFGKSR